MDAIFERFYQIDGHQAGTGIGLALVRAFVEMHGGQITAHSNEKGATFTVLFPAQSVSLYHPTVVTLPTEEAEVSATLIETDLPLDEEDTKTADRPTVLVIDDNADIRNYVSCYRDSSRNEICSRCDCFRRHDAWYGRDRVLPEVENRIADLSHSRDSSYSMFT